MLEQKITILGGGASGMIIALGLASKGIKSEILEKSNLDFAQFDLDIRNLALSKNSCDILKDYNIWKCLSEYSCPIEHIYISDNKDENILEFPASLIGHEMGYMMPNPELRKALAKAVKKHPLISLKTDTAYKNIKNNGDKAIITLENNKVIESDLVIAADGKFSKIRSMFFDERVEKNYKQHAIVFNVQHELPHNNAAIEHFYPNGPFAVLPLKAHDESSIVWTVRSPLAEIYLEMGEEEFLGHVERAFGDSKGKIRITSAVVSYPLTAHMSTGYYHGNIALIADAAHSIHPLAGQGLNQGIKDIDALVKITDRQIKSGLKINDPLALHEYQNSRVGDNAAMLFATDATDSIFSTHGKTISILRKTGMRILNKSDFLKKQFVKYAMGEM